MFNRKLLNHLRMYIHQFPIIVFVDAEKLITQVIIQHENLINIATIMQLLRNRVKLYLDVPLLVTTYDRLFTLIIENNVNNEEDIPPNNRNVY